MCILVPEDITREENEMKKYSVRREGNTSWTDPNSLKVARKERKLADRICKGHIIVNNQTNEQVS